MGFKSNAIIIGAPLVLYELPKYLEEIQTQSAHRHSMLAEKNNLISGYMVPGTWKKVNWTQLSTKEII